MGWRFRGRGCRKLSATFADGRRGCDHQPLEHDFVGPGRATGLVSRRVGHGRRRFVPTLDYGDRGWIGHPRLCIGHVYLGC